MSKQCIATTKHGTRCKNTALEGSDYCFLPTHNETGEGKHFAIGNSGKPKKWTTPDALQKDIDAYFKECDENKKLIYSKHLNDMIEIAAPIPYTIEGLCETLDCKRETLLNYEKQEGYEKFFRTIARAKMKIQRNKIERGLMGDSDSRITQFDLKNNHGYKDKSEVHNINENTHQFLDDLFPEVDEDGGN